MAGLSLRSLQSAVCAVGFVLSAAHRSGFLEASGMPRSPLGGLGTLLEAGGQWAESRRASARMRCCDVAVGPCRGGASAPGAAGGGALCKPLLGSRLWPLPPRLLPQRPQRGETAPSDMLPSLQTPLQCSPGRTAHQAVSMPRRLLIFKGTAQPLRAGWREWGSWPRRPGCRGGVAGPGDRGLEGSSGGS